MEMIKKENIILDNGPFPILADLYLKSEISKSPTLIYCHGYKGFKDWGHLPLMAESFPPAGINFLKFNFSHNGGTLDNPIDFPDLESFAKNNYSIELADLNAVVDWICDNNNPFSASIDKSQIYLMGHSRGGSIAIIHAASDERIRKLITWSAVGDFSRRFPTGKALAEWKKDGIMYVENARTKQKMPHNYQFYEDFLANQEKMDISRAEKALNIPHLIIHGTHDETVYLGEALHLMSLNNRTSLMKIQGGTHTLGASHPYRKKNLPPGIEKALNYTLTFINTEETEEDEE